MQRVTNAAASGEGETRRALLCERDPLIAERLRQMLRAEGFATCLVDTLSLFATLRQVQGFDLYAIGVVAAPDELVSLQAFHDLAPLLLLCAGVEESAVNPYRMTLPRAVLVDRELRDVDSIRRVLSGSRPPRAEAPPTSLSRASIRRAFAPFGLSVRQLEVLECALRGDTSADIAAKLFISELTVRNHLHAIYERVGVSGRRELLGRFVQGLIEGNA
jgi:DNA-binding CsgD family transcriptional regulator